MEHTNYKYIATLNAVLENDDRTDIIAITVVGNKEEGELWFCANKPEDGTQVDYVLHKISEVFAAPNLLAACKIALDFFVELDVKQGTVSGLSIMLNKAIALAEKE